MKRSGHGPVRLLSALALSAAAVLGCSSSVEIPPAGAAPQEVVRAYLKAIDAHDEDAGRTVSTALYAQEESQGDGPDLYDLASVSNIRIEKVAPVAGYRSPDGAEYTEATTVLASFDVEGAEEVGWPDGTSSREYILVRTGPDRAWRINELGGP